MYKIIKGKNRYELEKTVIEHIKQGWKPIGGFVYIERDQEMITIGSSFNQTLIKE